ncbi:MAG: hypothetical protein IJW31_05730 [Lentisphaeria bacterium]|nr:hypothetical protein [Lentisphaeria bacterium]
MKFYYFNATHWDREWYQGFQEYRKYLVDMAENLFDNFENAPEYNKFTFDGQTICLEDIEEIRPDLKEKLVKYISENKLNIGPWYVMPDEFLVSGEAIIRNWLIGEKVAKNYGGKCWPVCYICDIFGHTSQMPQLIKKFEFDGGVFWRGIDSKIKPFCFWQSPDKSEVKMVRLSPCDGYADFTLRVVNWTNDKLDEENFKTLFKEWVEKNKDFYGENFILSDALEHTMPLGDMSILFKWISDLYQEAEIIHTDYREVFADEYNTELQKIHNEQIVPCDNGRHVDWQISATLSSRYDIKRGNDLLQNKLEKVIDPSLAWMSLNGNTKFNYLADYAWKSLIKNHPHDSICGCSKDSVHRAMLSRFEDIDQVNFVTSEEILSNDREHVSGKSIRDVYPHQSGHPEVVRAEGADDGRYTVRICNTLPHKIKKISELELAFLSLKPYPEKMAEPFGYEFINCFRIYDEAGNEIPYQIRDIKRNQLKRFYRTDVRRYDVYNIVLETELKPSSWTSFRVEPSVDSKVRFFDSLFVNPESISNGKIRVDVKSDGTFDITDLRNNKVYPKQNNYFLDREIGDGWNHVRPVGNKRVIASSSAQVRVTCNMPNYAEFEITRFYQVPAELIYSSNINETFSGVEESAEIRTLKIISRVGIDSFSSNVHVKTQIDNNILDCRLQLRVPTMIEGDYFANQMFYFINRPEGRTWGKLSETFKESEVVEKNFNGIIGKGDKNGGIAFVADAGLHEAGTSAEDGEYHSMIVTLFRAFRRTVHTNGEVEGQLLKKMEFNYVLNCFDREPNFAELHREQLNLQTEFLTYKVTTAELIDFADSSVVKLSDNMAFSALKPTKDNEKSSCIFRFFNPSDKEENAEIEFAFDAEVSKTLLNEKVIENFGKVGKKLSIKVAPWEIVTLKLTVCNGSVEA